MKEILKGKLIIYKNGGTKEDIFFTKEEVVFLSKIRTNRYTRKIKYSTDTKRVTNLIIKNLDKNSELKNIDKWYPKEIIVINSKLYIGIEGHTCQIEIEITL